MVEFLKRNIDVFAWDACDAPGIDPAFICHHLNVNPTITLKKQPPRCPSREHADAIRDEVMKLKRAGAIKEVFYPEWLANNMVVTPQPKFIINLWVYMHVIVLIIFKCMKL